jgi:general stress protein 26
MASTHETASTEKLWKMIKTIRYAMLTSEDGDRLRSRPMAASQENFDGTLWFFTRADSHKVVEVEAHDRVGISYADPSSQTFVSLSGHARLERDPALIDGHWHESMRTWFPKGIKDPEIALLRVTVTSAEYWDAPSATMVHLYGYAKAVLTGQPPHPGDHAKLHIS